MLFFSNHSKVKGNHSKGLSKSTIQNVFNYLQDSSLSHKEKEEMLKASFDGVNSSLHGELRVKIRMAFELELQKLDECIEESQHNIEKIFKAYEVSLKGYTDEKKADLLEKLTIFIENLFNKYESFNGTDIESEDLFGKKRVCSIIHFQQNIAQLREKYSGVFKSYLEANKLFGALEPDSSAVAASSSSMA